MTNYPTADPRESGSAFMPELRHALKTRELDSAHTTILTVDATDVGLNIRNSNVTPSNISALGFSNENGYQAYIGAQHVGPGATAGGDFFIATRPVGGASPLERLRISSAGVFTAGPIGALTDGSSWALSQIRFTQNLDPSTGKYYLLNLQPYATVNSGEASYEKAGLIIQAKTNDPSNATDSRDMVGIDSRGIIASTNPSGRAWGINAQGMIEAGGDGLVVAGEFGLVNLGSDQPLLNTTTSKYVLHVISGGPVTCGINLIASSGGFHNGIYMEPSAILGTHANDSFIHLKDIWRVNKDGSTGIGTGDPTYKLQIAASSLASELLIGDLWFATQADAATRVNIGNTAANTVIKIGQASSDYGQFAWIYNATPASGFFQISTNRSGVVGGPIVLQPDGGNVAIGTSTPAAARLDVLSTTEQLRLSFDVSNFASFTVGSGGNLDITPTGDIVFNPGGKDILPNTAYDLNIGALNKKYLTLHAAELWVETLVAQDTIATIGGRVLVGPTTTLIEDFTSALTTIKVKHNQMVSGDRAYMEANGKVEFIAITSGPTTITGGYSYTVTRNLDGSGANDWFAGDAVFNTGQAGSGFIDLYSIRGVKASTQIGPTIVGNVRNDATYNNWSEHWAIGNLNGLYGYGATTFGVGFGKYIAGTPHITIDETNGYRIFSGLSTVIGQWDNSGVITVGEVAASKSNFLISAGALQVRNNTTVLAEWSAAGAITVGEVGASKSNMLISAGSLQIRNNTTVLAQWGSTGDITIGEVAAGKSNTLISAGALSMRLNTTNLFNIDTSGNVTLGTVATDQGNAFWNNTNKKLEFRGGTAGTVVQAYVDTTGAITAGGGKVLLNSTGIEIRSTAGASSYLNLYLSDVLTGSLRASATGTVMLAATLASSSTVNLVAQSNAGGSPLVDFDLRASSAGAFGVLWSESSNLSGLLITNGSPATAPTALLDVRGSAIFTGTLTAGSGPTVLTSATGKLLLAAVDVSVSSSGQVLTSTGTGTAPTWQSGSGGGANTALSNLASVAINAALVLGTSDAFALGSTAKQWSDLFLADGGVINWDNGDTTITHAEHTLNIGGASLGINVAPLFKFHLSGTSNAPHLSAVAGIAAFETDSTVELTMGGYTAGPFGFWLQTKDSSGGGGGSSTAYPLFLNPLGGNVGIGMANTAFGTSANKVLGIFNGTAPSTSPADMIQIFSLDLSAGNASLGLRTETAVVTESVAQASTLMININGVWYKLLLSSAQS